MNKWTLQNAISRNGRPFKPHPSYDARSVRVPISLLQPPNKYPTTRYPPFDLSALIRVDHGHPQISAVVSTNASSYPMLSLDLQLLLHFFVSRLRLRPRRLRPVGGACASPRRPGRSHRRGARRCSRLRRSLVRPVTRERRLRPLVRRRAGTHPPASPNIRVSGLHAPPARSHSCARQAGQPPLGGLVYAGVDPSTNLGSRTRRLQRHKPQCPVTTSS